MIGQAGQLKKLSLNTDLGRLLLLRSSVGRILLTSSTRSSCDVTAFAPCNNTVILILYNRSRQLKTIIFFPARERAKLNKSCNLIGSWSGGIFSSGPTERAESADLFDSLIYFGERISGFRQSSPFLHFHRRLNSARLSLLTIRWQGKPPQVKLQEFVWLFAARRCKGA